ncbi:protein dj-1beta-like isoform X2 [Sitodiplosis mosellana]|uniref:protein dj-1beta-like isoform X2 n=1 Tax=Sitodiplosis mosellana TaxID=263140 RepID=UPI00244403BF|nr:protein dj-1beta-like isoform X2 [Sitodiplosis mosellana]
MLHKYVGVVLKQSLRQIYSVRTFSQTKMANKSALALLANGTEEMEIVITVDVLRRAGVNVTVAGVANAEPTKCSRDVTIMPDKSLQDVAKDVFDVVILPGGLGGTDAFVNSPLVGEVLKAQESSGRLIAAICAAPLALSAHKIGLGKSITSYPSVKDKLTSDFKYVDDQIVVQDDKLITSRGPGTAYQFGLKIAEVLVGADKAKQVANGMLVDY